MSHRTPEELRNKINRLSEWEMRAILNQLSLSHREILQETLDKTLHQDDLHSVATEQMSNLTPLVEDQEELVPPLLPGGRKASRGDFGIRPASRGGSAPHSPVRTTTTPKIKRTKGASPDDLHRLLQGDDGETFLERSVTL